MNLWQDVRFGARLLVKDRWFTLAAATALALGIGANVAVFTFVNAALLRGLPFHEPDRLMAVWTENDRGRQQRASRPDYEDWRTESRAFSDLAGFVPWTMNVSDEARAPERFRGAYVSGKLFGLIGQPPAIGREFIPEDDQHGAEPVTIISHRVWQNRYDSDPAVLGRTLKVNSRVVTIIGVMPTDMRFPFNADIWVPAVQAWPDSEPFVYPRDLRTFMVIGRLAEETSVEQARVELATIGQRLAQAYPATNENITPTLMPYNERVRSGRFRLIYLALQGAVAFVLLIACANVASLLLARSAHRTQEISVRVALGASRWRVVRQLLVESVMLALIAGIAGFGLAVAGVRWFDAATQSVGRPYWMEYTMDGTVFAFMAAVCLATGIIFGLVPALHVSKTDVNAVLKEGARGGTGGLRVRRWTRALIVTEIALTIVLLAGAGFMMRSFLTLYRMDLGVDTSQLLTMRLALPFYTELAPRTELFRQFEERLAGINEIEASTLTTNTPLRGGQVRPLVIDGRPTPVDEEPPEVTKLSVSDGYFDTLGVQLLRGRAFTTADGRPGQESAIVNRRFVAMHFADEDPLGRRIKMLAGQVGPVPGTPEPTWLTIVGVSPDIRQRALQDPEPDPVVYVPHRIESPRNSTLILRTRGDPAAVTALVRDTMRVLEPDLPLFNIQTLDELLADQRWMFRTFGSMFAIFALIALVLSAVGLYAVTAYSVTQRTQELGLRVALGAPPGQVLWLVLRQGLLQLAIGLPIGLAGAFAVGRLLESVLVQTSPADPVTIVSIVAVVVGAAMLACLWPALRAARLDPSEALRYE